MRTATLSRRGEARRGKRPVRSRRQQALTSALPARLWPQNAEQVEAQIWDCIQRNQFALEGMEELSHSTSVSNMTRAAFHGLLRSRIGLVVGKQQLDALSERHPAGGGA